VRLIKTIIKLSFKKENTFHSGQENNIVEAFGSLLPETQGGDFQETNFANQMKRKGKRRKPKL
jgi:hypothetical protein